MKNLTTAIILLFHSSLLMASTITYTCESETNLELFDDGDSYHISISVTTRGNNQWGGTSYRLYRYNVSADLDSIRGPNTHTYIARTPNALGLKKDTQIILSTEIYTRRRSPETLIYISHPDIGTQTYYCEYIQKE